MTTVSQTAQDSYANRGILSRKEKGGGGALSIHQTSMSNPGTLEQLLEERLLKLQQSFVQVHSIVRYHIHLKTRVEANENKVGCR